MTSRLHTNKRPTKWLLISILTLLLSACSTNSIELYPEGYTPLDMSLNNVNVPEETASTTNDTPTVDQNSTPKRPIVKAVKHEPTFQIFLTQEAPDKVYNRPIELNERTIYSDDQILLTRNDLDNVVAKEDAQGRAWVILTLSPEGAQKLFAITQANMGKNLTISIKDQIVAVLEITEELERELIIPMRTAYQASVLQQQITDGD